MLLASLTTNLLTALSPDAVNRMATLPTEKRLTTVEVIARQLASASRCFLRDLDDTDDMHNPSTSTGNAFTLSRRSTLSQSSISSSSHSQGGGCQGSAGSSEDAVPVQALVCAAHFALLLHSLLCPPPARTHTSTSSTGINGYQLVTRHLPRESLWLARRVLKAYLSLCMSSRPSLAHALADGSVRSAPAICLSVLEEDNLKQCLSALRSFEQLDSHDPASSEDGERHSVAPIVTTQSREAHEMVSSNTDCHVSIDQEPTLSGWKRKRKLGGAVAGARQFV